MNNPFNPLRYPLTARPPYRPNRRSSRSLITLDQQQVGGGGGTPNTIGGGDPMQLPDYDGSGGGKPNHVVTGCKTLRSRLRC